MRYPRSFVLLLATCFLAWLAVSPAAARGVIEGSVGDRDGNLLAKVRVQVTPAHDAKLRSYPVKTSGKGTFFAMVGNGAYLVRPEFEGWTLDTMAIRIESRRKDVPDAPPSTGKMRVIYEWDGKIVPGRDLPPVGIGEGDRATVDFVLVEAEVARKERAEMLLGMTAAALERGDRDAAMRTVDDLLSIEPGDPLGLTLRAYIYLQEGEHGKAESDLKQALETDADSYDAWYQLATVQQRTDRAAEAVETYRRAATQAESGAQKSKALLSVGELERDAGKTVLAIEAFEAAIEADPTLEAAVAPELADLYTSLDDIESAGAWLEKAGSGTGVDPALEYNLGVAQFNKKEWEASAECFRKVLAADPDFADAHRNLASALLNLDRADESVEHFRRYLALRPDADDAEQIQAIVDHLSP